MDAQLLTLLAACAAAAASALAFVAYRRAARAASPAGEADAADGSARLGPLRALVSPLATRIRPTNQAELELLTTQLLNAGRRGRDAVDRFCEEKVLALLSGAALGLTSAIVIGGMAGMLLSLVIIVLGILGPSKLLALQAADRRDRVAQALPSAVDLLTTCIEAGLSLEHAIARVADEMELQAPILAQELRTTAKELDAGVALPDALRRMARRVGLDELSALAGVIAQAHGLGAPIGNTLREYAQSSRKQRTSMLEERAGKLAAQMTLPLATCLLPAAMMVILGPAVIQLVRALQ